MASRPERWRFEESWLDNGLRVLTLEDDRSPLVSVQVWYHVGSKDEDPNRQGFAHMFEHMMFRGTERIGPQDHFKYLQRYGARVNGYTSFDQTVYWEVVAVSQLDLALWLEAERLANLKINEDYFAAEREVVKEERRMRNLNRPYGKLYETLFDAAYTEHPYRWTPIGNMPHLNAATVDELRAFFQTFYIPNNAALVVVGRIKHDEVLARARQYFGPIPRRPDPPRVTITEPPMTGPRRVEITDQAPSPRVVLAYHAPSAREPDAIPLNVLTRILSVGQSSRLYRQLVLGKELAVGVYADDSALEQAGLFTLSATLKPDVTIEAGEKALQQEIDTLLADGITPAELTKAKNQAVAEYVRQAETVQGRAHLLGYAAVILDDPDRVNTDLDRTRAVTANDVMAVARRVFGAGYPVTIIVRPADDRPETEAVEDKSEAVEETIVELAPPAQMPTGQSPKPVNLPAPSVTTLDNGLQVAVFADQSAPSVTVSFGALIGAKDDFPDQAGLAGVTFSTLRRGTRQHTGDELAELIDSHAMSLTEQVQHDSAVVGMWTLAEHLDLATQTLAEVLREPTFPAKEVAGFVSRAVAREAINEEDPSTIASRAFARAIFGDHPRARPASGTSASLKSVTRQSVVDFHRRFVAPDVGTLIFAGDVTPDHAFALAKEHFGHWNARAEPTTTTPPPAPAQRHVLLVDRPAAPQSEIRIGQIVPLSRKDPDYPAARLLSTIFGESFSARLNRVLRIEKGLTYGVRGYFDVDADVASLQIGTFTRTDKSAEAIQAALGEVEKLSQTSVTPDELAQGRDMLIGGFQVGLETPKQLADRWWDLKVWRLPADWYDGYLHAIANTDDSATLSQVARRTVQPDKLTIVVVGNGSEIQPHLGKIAPVEPAQDP